MAKNNTSTIIFLIVASLTIYLVTSNFVMNASGLEGFFAGIPHSFVNGEYTSICYQMCFDLIKNSSTKGYDPKFLSMPEVKKVCTDAKDYGDMGYCDKSLGTL